MRCFLLLQKLENEPDAAISLETRDDIVFEKGGDAKELLQLKHTVKAMAGLSDPEFRPLGRRCGSGRKME